MRSATPRKIVPIRRSAAVGRRSVRWWTIWRRWKRSSTRSEFDLRKTQLWVVTDAIELEGSRARTVQDPPSLVPAGPNSTLRRKGPRSESGRRRLQRHASARSRLGALRRGRQRRHSHGARRRTTVRFLPARPADPRDLQRLERLRAAQRLGRGSLASIAAARPIATNASSCRSVRIGSVQRLLFRVARTAVGVVAASVRSVCHGCDGDYCRRCLNDCDACGDAFCSECLTDGQCDNCRETSEEA